MFHRRRVAVRLGWIASGLLIQGCVLAPAGTQDERARLAQAGTAYDPVLSARAPAPELPDEPGWRDVLQRAFLTNGDLEARYFEWKAALARVDAAAAYPNSNVMLTFNYLFSGEKVKGWDRTTLQAGFDSMQNLSFPTKVAARGRVALEEARTAAARFAAAKFDLQQQVLSAYYEYALAAERARLQRETVALLRLATDSAAARVRGGGAQQDLLAATVALGLAESELQTAESELPQLRTALNALVARRPQARLDPPGRLPPPRELPADDARLIAVGAERNPDLTALARTVAGRQNALALARQAFIPDINPFAAVTGSVAQIVGAAIVLPTTIPAIRATIRDAESQLRGSEATLRQARLDREARFVATLVALRNNEAQVQILADSVVPAAKAQAGSARQNYAAGLGPMAPVIESEQTLVDARVALAEARMQREKRLAELETLAGLDVETLLARPAGTAGTSVVGEDERVRRDTGPDSAGHDGEARS